MRKLVGEQGVIAMGLYIFVELASIDYDAMVLLCR
jgi:hypothetical protein